MPGFKADCQCCTDRLPQCLHGPAGHFQSDHHPCPHPACLERKFVVFAEEQDLRRHFAIEHGNETNMTRAQRRQVRAADTFCSFDAWSRTRMLVHSHRPVFWLQHSKHISKVLDNHVFGLHCDVCACMPACLPACLPVCRLWHSTSS